MTRNSVFEPTCAGTTHLIDVCEIDVNEIASFGCALLGRNDTPMTEETVPKFFPKMVNKKDPLVGPFTGFVLVRTGGLKFIDG
jgi:hypothetical protein